MLINWKLSKWESIEVDVLDGQSEPLMALGKEFERADENAGRRARRHKEVAIEEKFENANEQGEQFRWEPIDESANPHFEIERLETIECVRRTIANLSFDEQELIQAVFYDEVSIKEFARHKGVSFQAKYKQYHKILNKLKVILSKEVE